MNLSKINNVKEMLIISFMSNDRLSKIVKLKKRVNTNLFRSMQYEEFIDHPKRKQVQRLHNLAAARVHACSIIAANFHGKWTIPDADRVRKEYLAQGN